MRDRLPAFWQWVSTRRPWLLLALGAVVGIGLYLNYIRTTVGFLQWSGFKDKTLWDVLKSAHRPICFGWRSIAIQSATAKPTGRNGKGSAS